MLFGCFSLFLFTGGAVRGFTKLRFGLVVELRGFKVGLYGGSDIVWGHGISFLFKCLWFRIGGGG